MKVQRVEWHSYQLVYEYDVPDEEIEEKFGDTITFKEKLDFLMKDLYNESLQTEFNLE